MADQGPGFGETNTPERAGGIVRDHVRAVIESAEGNAAEIRRRAREDAEALDQDRADSASRLTTQLGELEGSFTSFGERLGQEVLPSGEIKGELGSGSEEGPAAAAERPDRTGSASAWRAPAESEPDAPQDPEESGLLGGLKKRFSAPEPEAPAETEEAEPSPEQETSEEDAFGDPSAQAAPAADSEAPSDWVPGDSEAPESETAASETIEPESAAADPEADPVSWAPSDAPETETEAGEEQSSTAESAQEEADATVESPGPDVPPEAPDASEAPPRGRIARLLLGRRPGE
ncbi:MAG: hypothetical protein WD649_04345 [Thermoleophilaceae bacterium]